MQSYLANIRARTNALSAGIDPSLAPAKRNVGGGSTRQKQAWDSDDSDLDTSDSEVIAARALGIKAGGGGGGKKRGRAKVEIDYDDDGNMIEKKAKRQRRGKDEWVEKDDSNYVDVYLRATAPVVAVDRLP